MYWTQFADEPSLVHDITSGNFAGVHDAEAKIWSFNGPKGNRYRTLDANGNPVYRNFGTRVMFDGRERTVNSVGDLLELSVAHALAGVTSGDIRITGHSLGSQVATTLAKRCTDKGNWVPV